MSDQNVRDFAADYRAALLQELAVYEAVDAEDRARQVRASLQDFEKAVSAPAPETKVAAAPTETAVSEPPLETAAEPVKRGRGRPRKETTD
jgi:hypothetical protein